jgi:hypothetical protein
MNSTHSWWLAIIDFFRRDLSSFIPTRFREPRNEAVSTSCRLEGSPETSSIPPTEIVQEAVLDNLPLVLDPTKVVMIQERRQISDWRDDAILKLSTTGTEVINAFSRDVKDRLADEPWWRRAWTRPANGVLKPDFDKRVRGAIRKEAKRQEQDLEKLIETLKTQRGDSLRLNAEWLDSQLSCVAMYGFRRSNEDKIRKSLEALALEPHGIVGSLHKQVIRIAVELTERTCRS